MKKEPGTGRVAAKNKTTSRGGGKKNVVRGKVNGKEVCILVDTGADYDLVPRAVVPTAHPPLQPLLFLLHQCHSTGLTCSVAPCSVLTK